MKIIALCCPTSRAQRLQSGEFAPSGDTDVTYADYPVQTDNEDGSPGYPAQFFCGDVITRLTDFHLHLFDFSLHDLALNRKELPF